MGLRPSIEYKVDMRNETAVTHYKNTKWACLGMEAEAEKTGLGSDTLRLSRVGYLKDPKHIGPRIKMGRGRKLNLLSHALCIILEIRGKETYPVRLVHVKEHLPSLLEKNLVQLKAG